MLILLGLNMGCVQEEVPVPVQSPEKEMITLYFRDVSRTTTRALTESQEGVVEKVDVLVFRYSNGEALFAERISIDKQDIRDVAGDDSKKEFTVTLSKDNNYYQLVILANARTEVNDYYVLNNNNLAGKLKEDILPEIISKSDGLWNTVDGSAAFRYIPMWGETNGSKKLTQLDKTDIKLFRSLVRVDVKVNAGVPFELKEIHVYNRPTRGRIAPDPTFWNDTQKRFIEPSLPSDLKIVDQAGGATQSHYTVTGQSVREIYLYETKEQGTQDFMKATFLVLGGIYHGKMNYYRVNFADMPNLPSDPSLDPDWWQGGPPTSGTGEGGMVGAGDIYHPLIRNHHYEISVTNVSGEGHTSPAEASKSITTRLSSVLLTWDNQNQNVIIDNNSYTFEVAPPVAYLKNAATAEITFKTSFPNPTWELGELTDTWFECSLKESEGKIIVTRKSIPSGGDGSVGYFTLKLKDGSKLKVSQQIKVAYQATN
jgi:hypothetical protein